VDAIEEDDDYNRWLETTSENELKDKNYLQSKAFFVLDPVDQEYLKKDDLKVIREESSVMLKELNEFIKDKIHYMYITKRTNGRNVIDEYAYNILRLEHSDDIAKFYATQTVYDAVQKKTLREIQQSKIVSEKTPTWKEIVEFYGGYSQLVKAGITKKDIGKFTVKTVLTKIGILDSDKCFARYQLTGNKDYGLKFYNIKETEFSSKGTYVLQKLDYRLIHNIISNKNPPRVKFKLENKLDNVRHTIQLNFKDIDPYINKKIGSYYSIFRQLVDDTVTDDEYDAALYRHPSKKLKTKRYIAESNKREIEQKRNEYIDVLSQMGLRIEEIEKLSLKELIMIHDEELRYLEIVENEKLANELVSKGFVYNDVAGLNKATKQKLLQLTDFKKIKDSQKAISIVFMSSSPRSDLIGNIEDIRPVYDYFENLVGVIYTVKNVENIRFSKIEDVNYIEQKNPEYSLFKSRKFKWGISCFLIFAAYDKIYLTPHYNGPILSRDFEYTDNMGSYRYIEYTEKEKAKMHRNERAYMIGTSISAYFLGSIFFKGSNRPVKKVYPRYWKKQGNGNHRLNLMKEKWH